MNTYVLQIDYFQALMKWYLRMAQNHIPNVGTEPQASLLPMFINFIYFVKRASMTLVINVQLAAMFTLT